MRRLDHQNIVQLKYFFFSSGDKVRRSREIFNIIVVRLSSLLQLKEEVYLNLVLEFIPETAYRVARHYTKQKQTIPILYVKVGVNCFSFLLKETICVRWSIIRSYTCINFFAPWPIFIRSVFVIEISNLRIYS